MEVFTVNPNNIWTNNRLLSSCRFQSQGIMTFLIQNSTHHTSQFVKQHSSDGNDPASEREDENDC